MTLKSFENIHHGHTMLLVGNGENLNLTPPEWFDYPSIGMNTIVLYKGWKPDYYIAVDRRVEKEFGGRILSRYADVPKLIPNRMSREWTGQTFHRWDHNPGPLWSSEKGALWQNDIEGKINYGNVMHVAMKIAFYMGAKTILIIGMEHNPKTGQPHFWGTDTGMPVHVPLKEWLEGYRQIVNGLHNHGVEIYNISPGTFVPEEIIPRDDWRKYANAEAIKK